MNSRSWIVTPLLSLAGLVATHSFAGAETVSRVSLLPFSNNDDHIPIQCPGIQVFRLGVDIQWGTNPPPSTSVAAFLIGSDHQPIAAPWNANKAGTYLIVRGTGFPQPNGSEFFPDVIRWDVRCSAGCSMSVDGTPIGASSLEFGAHCGIAVTTGGTTIIPVTAQDSVVGTAECTTVVTYCTSGTTSSGCTPSISATGLPSASAAAGFTIDVTQVEAYRNGLIFYGVSGRTSVPWGASVLCVAAPTQRTGYQDSGGTGGTCDGAFTLDFNEYIANNPGALGQPFAGGDVIDAQAWFRDPASSKTTALSNALEFTLVP